MQDTARVDDTARDVEMAGRPRTPPRHGSALNPRLSGGSTSTLGNSSDSEGETTSSIGSRLAAALPFVHAAYLIA